MDTANTFPVPKARDPLDSETRPGRFPAGSVIIAGLLLVLLAPSVLTSESAPSEASASMAVLEMPSSQILERYVAEGLRGNLALAQREIDVETSLAALDEARALFRPSLSLNARYSRAGGGRNIEFPVGDLLNPVYSSLNEILAQSGQSPRFGQLDNVAIPFLREREQDTRLRLFQPVYRPELRPNLRLRKALAAADALSVDSFRRQLERDIRVAYFDWLRAQRFVEIAESTRALVAENLRVNRSQYDSGSLTRDEVLRVEAELSSVDQELLDIERQVLLASSYFNFLLNRSIDSEIDVDNGLLEGLRPGASTSDDSPFSVSEEVAMTAALSRREELFQLDSAIEASLASVALSRAERRPSFDLAIDYGIEGESYELESEADFWQASLVLSWTFWNSGATDARRRQAELEAERLEVQRRELEQQIRLEVREAWRRLEVALRSVSVARQRLASAEEAYRIVERRYDAGVVPQVSLIDARSELTRARVGLTTTFFDRLSREADLERVLAEKDLPGSNAREDNETTAF